MSHWRLYTIRLLVAVFLVLFVLLLSHVEAQGVEQTEEWLPCEDLPGSHHYCSYHENFIDAPINVYHGRVLNEYVDDEGLAVDVEEEQEHGVYDEFYRGGGFSLPHCPQNPAEEDSERPAVVVSTLDGRITALDLLTGAVLWSHQTGDGSISSPLLSSSMSKLEVTSRGEWVRLIPSLDGGIFRFDGEGLEALPVTADTLLHSSFKFNPEAIFTGAKVTEVWGLALRSGRVTYICLASGCKRQRTATPAPSRLLVVRRVTQTVRAVDPRTGDERWNFSVGQHEVNLGGSGGCGSEGARAKRENPSPLLPSLHFVIPEGVIMGMNEDNMLIWQQKLTSPVVSAWRVLEGELEEVDLFSTSSIPALSPGSSAQDAGRVSETGVAEKQPVLYVGVHQKQLYIQQSTGMHNRLTSSTRVLTAETDDPQRTKYPRVQWRPYLASAPSRTPIVNYNSRQHPLLLSFEPWEEPSTAVALMHHVDYPFDNGYYLYADDTFGQLNLSRPWHQPDSDAEDKEETLMDEVTSQIMHICFHIGPDTWIKLGVAVGCYALLHYLLLRYIMVYMRRQLTRQALTLVTQMFNLVLQNNPQILALMQRMGMQLQALPAPPPPPPPTPPDEGEEKALPAPTAQAQENPSLVERADSSTDYSSRYLTDFEVVQQLGRGGFGVVCQVRNKLDENEYAVKRIILPTKKSSAERVKREVRALAKLNHTNIVRYYNSWLETPPPGWQDPHDTLLHSGDVLSVSSLFSPGTEESHNEVFGVSAANNRPEEDDKSLYGVVRQLGVNGMMADIDTWGNDELTSGYEEDGEGEDEDSSQSSSGGGEWRKSSEWTKAKEQESSLDIVFEDSKSSVALRKELSAESRGKVSDSESGGCVQGPQVANPTHSMDSWDRVADDSHSESVVFENSGTSSHSKNNTDQVINDNTNNTGQEESLHGEGKKRRRVKSQPGRDSHGAKQERPRTLSLGSTTTDRVKVVPHDRAAAKPSSVPRTFLYIQMELCQKESLRDWLVQNPKRDKRVVLDMFNDIICAVEYVHDNQLMHRDLKPSNIFFSLEGKVKVGDFGLVTTIAEEEEQQQAYTPATHPHVFPAERAHTHRVGTRLYMSPEQLSGQLYDYKVDIYSLGLIFFEMLVPFGTGMERLEVMTRLREETRFPANFEDSFPDESSLLKLMLSRDPACRPTTRGIRARKPLRSLQGHNVEDISPEDHFRLSRQRSHFTTTSSSSAASLSTSSTTST